MAIEQAFLDQARELLLKDFFPKIEKSVDHLSEEDLWWRAHETDNAVGNLLLHLAGNVRQWIVSGIGAAPDRRERKKEFSQREPLTKGQLLSRLRETLAEADQVLASMDHAQILTPRFIQFTERTRLQAVFHVVEHFAYHTGQICYITKLRTGRDLGFYKELEKTGKPEDGKAGRLED
ncbi:MAG: DUF1572 family protein [Acidobacteria bacterium]|nr:DUF1572 family protein [Acidobacteriota bacterium]